MNFTELAAKGTIVTPCHELSRHEHCKPNGVRVRAYTDRPDVDRRPLRLSRGAKPDRAMEAIYGTRAVGGVARGVDGRTAILIAKRRADATVALGCR